MGDGPLQFGHHLIHLIGVNRWIVPLDAIASLTKETTDLAVCHASDELSPWGLTLSVGHTCFRCVVEKLIVTDPQGSVPGLVVCPAVVCGGGCCHLFGLFGMWPIWQGLDPIASDSGQFTQLSHGIDLALDRFVPLLDPISQGRVCQI